jgi:hypothetical protein
MLNERLAPLGELALRIGRDLWKFGQPGRLRHVLHCFAQQRFLGPELAEDRDLVDAGRVGNAPSGRATETVLREDFGSGGKDFVSAIHGADINGDPPQNASSHLLTQ